METTLRLLSECTPAQLDKLAALHSQVMHTLLADLGTPLVLHYYQAAQADARVIGYCAYTPSGQIEGWAVGSPDPSALNTRLREPLSWFIAQMLKLALTRPNALLELLRTLLTASDANQLQSRQIELTYIGVSPSSQGKGLGKELLQTFSTAARTAGYSAVVLSVETDNPAAVGLYQRCGFKITRTFREGRFERHRMELPLGT